MSVSTLGRMNFREADTIFSKTCVYIKKKLQVVILSVNEFSFFETTRQETQGFLFFPLLLDQTYGICHSELFRLRTFRQGDVLLPIFNIGAISSVHYFNGLIGFGVLAKILKFRAASAAGTFFL